MGRLQMHEYDKYRGRAETKQGPVLIEMAFNIIMLGFTILLTLILLNPEVFAANSGPRTVDLFPATVIADIKATEAMAKKVETGLEAAISEMDKQKKMFDELDCTDNIDSDEGCAAVRKQIANSYQQMIKVLGDELPNMKKSIRRAKNSLEARIATKIGGAMSARGLQDRIATANDPIETKVPASIRGRKGQRLSQRFSQYYKLIADSGSSNRNSLTNLAASMYLDMDSALTFIDLIDMQIQHDTAIYNVESELGYLSPEMQDVVDGVKTILFGEDMSVAEAIPDPIGDQNEPTAYRSPFEQY